MATVTKAVRKDNSADAVKARKQAKQYRNKNKGKLNAKAKRDYKTMKPKEKKLHLENQVRLKAMRHGATAAEAEKAVKAYRLNKRRRMAGKHASAKIGAARNQQREVRANIRNQAAQVRDAHRAALAKIKAAGGTPAQRSKMRQAEKKRFANDRSKLASLRKKAVGKHKNLLTNIKSKSQAFRLKDFISNYSKTPLSRKGKRLKTIDPKAVTAAISNKHFGGKTSGAVKKPRKAAGSIQSTGPGARKAPKAAPAATAPHGVKKDGTPAAKRGRKPAADKAAAPAAAAPVAKKAGRPKKAAAAPAAPAQKLNKDGSVPKKRGRKPAAEKAAAAPAVAAKPAKKTAAKKAAAAPAQKLNKDGSVPKKRGRKSNAEKAAATPVKAAAAKAAKAPAKAAAKTAAKPAAKAAAKPVAKAEAKKVAAKAAKPAAKAAATKAAKAPAKAAAKTAAKPVAKKEAAKVAAKVATKVATKAAAKATSKGKAVPAKTGGAKAKSANKKATLS